MEAVLDLDLLIEQARPQREVKICGDTHKLRRISSVEDMLFVSAIHKKAKGLVQHFKPGQFDELASGVDSLKAEIRGMIVAMLPTLPMEELERTYPTLPELNSIMISLMTQCERAMPDSVKKNSSRRSKGTSSARKSKTAGRAKR